MKIKKLILIFSFFYLYAIIRYHFGKGVPFWEFCFVLNKSLAWFSFTLIGLSIIPQTILFNLGYERKSIGITGFFIAGVHVFLNIILINPERFPRLYSKSGSWNSDFYFIIFSGILIFILFTLVFVTSINLIKTSEVKRIKLLKIGYKAFLISLLHPFFVGNETWVEPCTWPYYLPPITLLSVLFGLTYIGLRLILKKEN